MSCPGSSQLCSRVVVLILFLPTCQLHDSARQAVTTVSCAVHLQHNAVQQIDSKHDCQEWARFCFWFKYGTPWFMAICDRLKPVHLRTSCVAPVLTQAHLSCFYVLDTSGEVGFAISGLPGIARHRPHRLPHWAHQQLGISAPQNVAGGCPFVVAPFRQIKRPTSFPRKNTWGNLVYCKGGPCFIGEIPRF